MQLILEETIIRKIRDQDLSDYAKWFTPDNEWLEWDAPWEKWEEKEVFAYIEGLKSRIDKAFDIHYRLEISTAQNKHIGWVSSYKIGKNAENLAVGINIPEISERRNGHAFRALKLFIGYIFEKTSHDFLYTETWSGNIAMVKLAEKLGFSVYECHENEREVRGAVYAGLVFRLSREQFFN